LRRSSSNRSDNRETRSERAWPSDTRTIVDMMRELTKNDAYADNLAEHLGAPTDHDRPDRAARRQRLHAAANGRETRVFPGADLEGGGVPAMGSLDLATLVGLCRCVGLPRRVRPRGQGRDAGGPGEAPRLRHQATHGIAWHGSARRTRRSRMAWANSSKRRRSTWSGSSRTRPDSCPSRPPNRVRRW